MPINLIKLCVGADTLGDLEDWVRKRVAFNEARGLGRVHDHVTRMFPRRRDDVLAGGSLYWVIRGVILARQAVIDLRPATDADRQTRCAILLDPLLVQTEAQPRRAFQGWRYFATEDAPRDLDAASAGSTPPHFRAKLAELGLL